MRTYLPPGLAIVALGVAIRAGAPPIQFREVAAEAKVTFVLENCPTDRKRLIETIPGGVAVFDYDGDGRPDIYFTNGAEIPLLEKSATKYWNRLYRNEGNWKFRDVTEAAGVAGAGYSMGAAAADYDNDGRADLFVAGVNRNILYHNLGGGRFEDVTAKAGIASGEWAVAAGWFDYDRDGRLDLWVVRYAKWSPAFDRFCGDSERGLRIYCHPKYFEGLGSALYHNLGGGRFEDVTARAGLAPFRGRGMSVAFADYDGDGFPDVFVSNDNMPNYLFHNQRNGTFEEVALVTGAALRDHGKPVSSMGAEFKDYDNDGRPDIFVTALAGETFPLFRNLGKTGFADATYSSRLGPQTVKHSGWGLGLFDFNNDGWKDLFTANSHVNDRVEKFEAAVYRENDRVYANTGGIFQDVSSEAGLTLAKAHRGRFRSRRARRVMAQCQPTARPLDHSAIAGTRSNRDGIGALIRIGSQTAEMTTTLGYASSADWGVHFGLGPMARIPRIEIRWPGGIAQTLSNVEADRTLIITEPN